jgi:hypothetical protein
MPLENFYAGPVGTFGNALLNWTNDAPNDVVLYAISYRNAAQNLVSSHQSRGMSSIDYAACPIIFLFRHSIELYLKCLVYRIARLSVEHDDVQHILPRLWREHSLMRLLGMAKPVLTAMSSQLPSGLRNFDPDYLEFLENLDNLDTGSYTFRYPVTSRGNAALNNVLLTNIFRVDEESNRVLDFLNSLCRYFIEEIQTLAPQAKLDLRFS